MTAPFIAVPSYEPADVIDAAADSVVDGSRGASFGSQLTDSPSTAPNAARIVSEWERDAGAHPGRGIESGGYGAVEPDAPRAGWVPEFSPELSHDLSHVNGESEGAAVTRRLRPRTDASELGPLAPFAEQQGVTDLFINGDSGLWFDRGHGTERAHDWSLDEAEVRDLAVRLIARGGRHIDESTPCVDVRLGDGIRVHAVLPPISSSGTLLSVRLPSAAGFDLEGLRDTGLLGEGRAADATYLRLCGAVEARENILVTGAAGSGKTTLLAALLGLAAPSERIVTLEDVAELRIRHPHVVSLEARQANLEGAGRLGLETLLREALRMRPDRLVLGECRGAEIRELLAALNTGHDGGAGTLHANSLNDVPARLEALGALAGMSTEAVARQTVSAIGLVLHIDRRDGLRRLSPPGRFVLDANGRLAVRLDTEE